MKTLEQIREDLNSLTDKIEIEKSLRIINKAIENGELKDDVLLKAKYIKREKKGNKWVYTYAESNTKQGKIAEEVETKPTKLLPVGTMTDRGKILEIEKVSTRLEGDKKAGGDTVIHNYNYVLQTKGGFKISLPVDDVIKI